LTKKQTTFVFFVPGQTPVADRLKKTLPVFIRSEKLNNISA